MERVRVGRMLREMLAACIEDVHAAKLSATVKVVEGIIVGSCLRPATIGRNLPGSAYPKHGIKCVDRLLGSATSKASSVHFFRALAARLLADCRRPIILVDWTHAGFEQEALVAAIPVGGRALPIYLEVHPLKKLGNANVERRFIRTLRSVLPAESRAIVVTDAGYKGPFFKAVVEQGWDFVGRIRGTAKAFDGLGRKVSKTQLYAKATPTPTDLGLFALFVKQRIPARLVVVRKRRKPGRKAPPPKNREQREMRQAAKDPWLLATSITDLSADQIVLLYGKRMQIEETFRTAKSHRFGWSFGTVNLSTSHRTAVLLTLASLAMAVVTLIGMAAERHGLHRAFQANTTRRRALSFAFLAQHLLKRSASLPLLHADLLQILPTMAPSA